MSARNWQSHENVTPEALDKILETLPKDAADYHDPKVTWQEDEPHFHAHQHPTPAEEERKDRDPHTTRN